MQLRRTRQRKADVSSLSVDQKRDLLYGKPFIVPAGFQDEDEMRRAWEAHREALLEEWQEKQPPGTRPFAMYLFELVPEFGERRTTPHFKPAWRANWLEHGLLHTHLLPPMQEPEAEYLLRHGVIDEWEYEQAFSDEVEDDDNG